MRIGSARAGLELAKKLALTSALLAAAVCAQAAPAPKILALKVSPPSLTLDSARDVRKLIVSGKTADGFWIDLTPQAHFLTVPILKRDAEGTFRAVKPGKASLTVTAAGQ